jgi:2-polyprenyl-3-methyl-5-hydroxy-6-metoxy-1,4-benzoquinol methylase
MILMNFISKITPTFLKEFIKSIIFYCISSYLNSCLEYSVNNKCLTDVIVTNKLIKRHSSLFFDYIILNQKNIYNYLEKLRINEINKIKIPNKPVVIGLKSKICTQSDLESPWCRYWLSDLKLPYVFHSKYWEYSFVLQALFENNLLMEDSKGLGLACGQEILPSFLASKGCQITASDKPDDTMLWSDTGQYTSDINALYKPIYLNKYDFFNKVSFEYIDMNCLPTDLYNKFNFCWSICALEHLGSIKSGLDFIINSVKLLQPGGVAIHTTEFNFLDIPHYLDTNTNVIFSKNHLVALYDKLISLGYIVSELDFDAGTNFFDMYIDMPPFPYHFLQKLNTKYPFTFNSPHLKINCDGYPSSCFGIIIKKPY